MTPRSAVNGADPPVASNRVLAHHRRGGRRWPLRPGRRVRRSPRCACFGARQRGLFGRGCHRFCFGRRGGPSRSLSSKLGTPRGVVLRGAALLVLLTRATMARVVSSNLHDVCLSRAKSSQPPLLTPSRADVEQAWDGPSPELTREGRVEPRRILSTAHEARGRPARKRAPPRCTSSSSGWTNGVDARAVTKTGTPRAAG